MANRSKSLIITLFICIAVFGLPSVHARPSNESIKAFEHSFKICSKSGSITASGPMGLSITHTVLGRNSAGCQVELQMSHPVEPEKQTIISCIMNPEAPYTHQMSDLFNNSFKGCSLN
ncbi:hypothetical protein [Endozoicomonas atrinae]|uniref:hypothetical protein n=1 Tax=Endozoicomonas atrinae TaxID=1333660 RepID=UPI000A4B4CBD|nr:hypothetical protein [Endozoicomonas atrinae]